MHQIFNLGPGLPVGKNFFYFILLTPIDQVGDLGKVGGSDFPWPTDVGPEVVDILNGLNSS